MAHAATSASERRRGAVWGWVGDPRRRGILALAATIALLPSVLRNDYFYDVAILVALNAITCVGLNLLIGYAGQISLGHAGFFALGAYGTGILSARFDWPAWLSVPASVAAVALLAIVVGRPTLRLRGHYLAMATLGLGVIISIVLTTEDRLTGGPDGMAVPPLVFFGVAVQGERVWYWITGGALLLAVGAHGQAFDIALV
ncbi:MAG: branched-chain amino acid ABC transporter permease, partial [Betaproteobacteria bacterium]